MAVRELSPARCTSASPLVLARRTKLFALSEMRWAALALGLFSAGLLTQLCGAPQWVRWALFLACYATGGWEPGLAGLQALQRRTLDVDLLMVVAAIGAAAIGQIAEGALLIVIFATSGALEALVTARTADSVRGLMGLAPGTATRVGAGGGEETVNAADLRIGDIVLVRPGERISADATVLAGGGESRSGHRHRRAAARRQVNRRSGVRRHCQRHRRPADPGRPARAGFRRRSHCHPG